MATQIDHYLTPEMQEALKNKTSDSAGYVLLIDDEYVVVGDTSNIDVDSEGTVHTEYLSKSMNWINKVDGSYPAFPKKSGHKTILKVAQTVSTHSSSTGEQTADGYELYLDDVSTTLTTIKEGTYYPSNGYWRYSNGNQVVKSYELYAFGEETSLFSALTSSEKSSAGVSGTWYWLSYSVFAPSMKGESYPVKTSSGTVVSASWNGKKFKNSGSAVSDVAYFAIDSSYISTVTSSEKSNVL